MPVPMPVSVPMAITVAVAVAVAMTMMRAIAVGVAVHHDVNCSTATQQQAAGNIHDQPEQTNPQEDVGAIYLHSFLLTAEQVHYRFGA